MSLIGTAKAAKNESFKDRVQSAVILSAIDIRNGGLPMGDPKDSFALQILQNPEAYGRDTRFVWLTASNAAISASVAEDGEVQATDDDIQYVVNSVWETLFPTPLEQPPF